MTDPSLMCGASFPPSSHLGLGTCSEVPGAGDLGEPW